MNYGGASDRVALAFWVIQSVACAVLTFMVGFDWLVPSSGAAAPAGAVVHQQQQQQQHTGGVQPAYSYQQPTGSSMPRGQPQQLQQVVHSAPHLSDCSKEGCGLAGAPILVAWWDTAPQRESLLH
jgi:hypothetical protein